MAQRRRERAAIAFVMISTSVIIRVDKARKMHAKLLTIRNMRQIDLRWMAQRSIYIEAKMTHIDARALCACYGSAPSYLGHVKAPTLPTNSQYYYRHIVLPQYTLLKDGHTT